MSLGNPLGVHFIFTHKSQQQYDFIRAMQPGILKVVGSSTPDVQEIADSYAAAPHAILYLRNHARSEQHDFLWRDPIRCARQHVQEWHADLEERQRQAKERGLTIPDRSQMHLLGINEPVIELFARKEDMSNYDEWLAMVKVRAAMLDDYMVIFGTEANALGYPVGLGNISSGQPPNLRPGMYATFDWFPKTRKFLERTRDTNVYACHEYWRAETGPEGHADWHAWRFMHLELDANIDVLECGVDQQITTEDPHGNRGWTGHMNATAYVDQHRRYFARACTDSRFRGATPFTLNGDKIWESFWVDYCMPEMLALSAELRSMARPTVPDSKLVTVHLPGVFNSTPIPLFMRGDLVRTTTTVNARQTPGTQGKAADDVVAQMTPNTPLELLEGPQHADGLVWWRTAQGWVAEVAPNGLALLTAKVSHSEPVVIPSGAINPIVAEAILEIESGGNAFASDGRLVIRFEAHLFRRYLEDNALFDTYFYHDPQQGHLDQKWRRSPRDGWQPVHLGSDDFDANQRQEWEVFSFATKLDRFAALSATSMGAPQIMGFNHKRIGYASPEAMYRAFQRSEVAQTIGFFNYCITDPDLFAAMRQGDWTEIARRYNGDSDQVPVYIQLMKDAYQRIIGG